MPIIELDLKVTVKSPGFTLAQSLSTVPAILYGKDEALIAEQWRSQYLVGFYVRHFYPSCPLGFRISGRLACCADQVRSPYRRLLSLSFPGATLHILVCRVP